MKGQSGIDSTVSEAGDKLGTYLEQDVRFLLSPLSSAEIEQLYTAPAEKEVLIQQGLAHYSEMLSREQKPDKRYLKIFEQSLQRFGERMGRDIAQLAVDLAARVHGPITLLSLVRAGVPIGVLLVRALRLLDRECMHYGISIIRDKGIDINAMRYALERHDAQGIVFVDGWTGKGAISDELESSMVLHPELGVEPRLVTLTDPAGRAWLSASTDDWLIPSGILGSTVSGLISRSVLRKGWQESDDFHATAQLDELAASDLSRSFVDTVHQHVLAALPTAVARQRRPSDSTDDAAERSKRVIANIAGEFNIQNFNRIKPGIAEATRAVLRRVPERIILSSVDDDDLAALVHLATEAGVSMEQRGTDIHPYRAITVIAHRGSATGSTAS